MVREMIRIIAVGDDAPASPMDALLGPEHPVDAPLRSSFRSGSRIQIGRIGNLQAGCGKLASSEVRCARWRDRGSGLASTAFDNLGGSLDSPSISVEPQPRDNPSGDGCSASAECCVRGS
jgi:hypothetical protein